MAVGGAWMPRKKGVEKVQTIIRLTPDAKSLLEKLAAKRGMPANIYVETFVREQARREGIKPDVEE